MQNLLKTRYLNLGSFFIAVIWLFLLRGKEKKKERKKSLIHPRQSTALFDAIREYEGNKWKIIGQKVGKPAKVSFATTATSGEFLFLVGSS